MNFKRWYCKLFNITTDVHLLTSEWIRQFNSHDPSMRIAVPMICSYERPMEQFGEIDDWLDEYCFVNVADITPVRSRYHGEHSIRYFRIYKFYDKKPAILFKLRYG